jgi:hypothetical protein
LSELGGRMKRLVVCYGSPERVRVIEGDDELVDEVGTALFTAAAIECAAPHDCSLEVWTQWVRLGWFDETGEPIGSAGGGVCPQECGAACPLQVAP